MKAIVPQNQAYLLSFQRSLTAITDIAKTIHAVNPNSALPKKMNKKSTGKSTTPMIVPDQSVELFSLGASESNMLIPYSWPAMHD